MDRIRNHLEKRWEQAQKYEEGEAIHADGFGNSFLSAQRGQLGLQTVLAAFVVVIAAFVVVIVLDEFNSSIGTPSNESLNASKGDLLSGFASMVSLIEPLLLIGIGVVIISLIRRVG